MAIYVQAEAMPLVLEFLGVDDVDEVSTVVEQAIRNGFVFTAELSNDGVGHAEDVMVNFAALAGISVNNHDPRNNEGWDDRLIYSLALPEFAALVAAEERI